MVSHGAMSADDCPLNRWTKHVLEQMYQSLHNSEGGLRGCIQQALLSHPESSCISADKVHTVAKIPWFGFRLMATSSYFSSSSL